jgi:hypothetical protein
LITSLLLAAAGAVQVHTMNTQIQLPLFTQLMLLMDKAVLVGLADLEPAVG